MDHVPRRLATHELLLMGGVLGFVVLEVCAFGFDNRFFALIGAFVLVVFVVLAWMRRQAAQRQVRYIIIPPSPPRGSVRVPSIRHVEPPPPNAPSFVPAPPHPPTLPGPSAVALPIPQEEHRQLEDLKRSPRDAREPVVALRALPPPAEAPHDPGVIPLRPRGRHPDGPKRR